MALKTPERMMPRQFFRKISPSRRRVIGQRWLKPFLHLLDHPDLWAIRRRSVAPGVAVGLFWTWIPIPAHSFAAGASAIALRVHLPLSMMMTAIVNPLTVVPIYLSGYLFGKRLLGTPDLPQGEWNTQFISDNLSLIWQPLLLGNLMLGILSAMLGFLLVEGLWRTRVGQYLNERRARRAQRR